MSPHNAVEGAVLVLWVRLFLIEDDRAPLRNYWSNVTNDYKLQVALVAAVESRNEFDFD